MHPTRTNVEDVVGTAGNPIIAIFVATAACKVHELSEKITNARSQMHTIAGEVHAVELAKVGLLEALVVAIDGAHLDGHDSQRIKLNAPLIKRTQELTQCRPIPYLAWP